MKKETILFIEDDEAILGSLTTVLERENYHVLGASSAERALELLSTHRPDLVLLDLNLPGMSGIEFAKHFKSHGELSSIPIIVLTGISFEDVLVEALESYADDYIIKPFRPRVLKARLAAVLRRNYREEEKELLQVDARSFSANLNGEALSLTRSEFFILNFLVKNPNIPFSREEIIKQIRGEDYHVVSRSLDYQIFCLRKKMGEFAYLIETVRGIGFRYRQGE